MSEGKKSDEILREMRREVERAAEGLRKAAGRAIDRAGPESRELLTKADHFLAKLGRGTDVLLRELDKDFRDIAGKLKEAVKDEPRRADEPPRPDEPPRQ